jgi:hypothetical protein
MVLVSAILTGLGEGLRLALALFQARNSPAMQANAKAATIAKIRASVDQHIAEGDLRAVQSDGST